MFSIVVSSVVSVTVTPVLVVVPVAVTIGVAKIPDPPPQEEGADFVVTENVALTQPIVSIAEVTVEYDTEELSLTVTTSPLCTTPTEPV